MTPAPGPLVPLVNPAPRGQLRLRLGSLWFRLRRHLDWHLSRDRYARERVSDWHSAGLPVTASRHQSPLLRSLRNVDMYLQYNKITNLRLAISRLDGIILQPGEVFSFWRLVGKPSRRKGYLPGLVLINGGFRPGTGGGLCQLSNLIYWMTLHTPLTVVERYRHQYDVFPDAKRTLPFGSGATVSYNYVDLQIQNDTDQPFALHLWLDDSDLHGAWHTSIGLSESYEVYERNHAIRQLPSGHYTRHNQIWRRVYGADSQLHDDQIVVENHAVMMYSPLLPEGSKGTN